MLVAVEHEAVVAETVTVIVHVFALKEKCCICGFFYKCVPFGNAFFGVSYNVDSHLCSLCFVKVGKLSLKGKKCGTKLLLKRDMSTFFDIF